MKNITLTIASASAILLGQQVNAAEVNASTVVTDSVSTPNQPYAPSATAWKFDTAVLHYSEKGRVTATEPVISASKDFGGERVLNLKLVFDALSGASPNGAAPAGVKQTFTGPSGASGNDSDDGDDGDDDGEGSKPAVIKSNALPTARFEDTRFAGNIGWTQPLSATTKGSVGGNFSSETDFKSVGLNAALSKDFNDKNTTISAGVSFEFDSIDPVGGAPVALTDTAALNKEGNKTKTVTEAILGVTQLLSPKAYYQMSYSYSDSNGYMNDPYKILTLLDSNYNLIPKTEADTYTYLYENRPNKRVRHALFNRLKFKAGDSIWDASYRYTTDDWGVKTHTVDTKVRLNLVNEKYYVEPHVRWYQQSKANFYAPYLIGAGVDNLQGNPEFASADSRLGAFSAMTVGGKIGWNLSRDQEISLRVEAYNQKAKNSPVLTTGSLKGQTLQPNLNALMAQLSYRFKW